MLRVQTGERSWAVAQTFLEAKPKTVWRKILENHMDDESFKDIENPGLKEFRNSHKMAFYHSIENMVYYSKQCELKILWTSPAKTDVSFGFPKKSPLLPFFKYAYKKLRQTGTLLIFTVKVQWKNCISHQITAFKLHLDCSSINSKIEEKSYKNLIFLQPKYCYWINVKIIFKNCKV